ncbi:leukotriene A4 hydrolase N-terminal domain-containing protein [Piromyces finnis]|uniref:Leukotriene A4 hydrolase N-terminal domain-containing protein n=1 Tax=Piromyces finnis TaxID=1754191 RepID=A0A1Y1V6U4_9FUNG|nr:leukotriene A4 hydrolase N-terminal domain-containing protein [Piromyces finnis]|eukprot:ORX48626.1 leukotriene A4 hydrolase N-terminal domain-containing protein [Piromyces finnis]
MTTANKYKIKNILVPQKKINYQSLYDISEKSILPTLYQLVIKPNFDRNVFFGRIEIPLIVLNETNVIKFHSANLQITNVKVLIQDDSQEIKPSNVINDDFFETISLEFNEHFYKNQKPILILEYTGFINNEFHDKYEETVGFVKDSYITPNNEKKNIYYTKCLYSNSRRIFPCWDFPSLKVPVNLSLEIPNSMNALFNSEIKTITSNDDTQLKTIEFETTIPISTINIELIIGEFNYIERLSEICLKTEKLPIRLYSVQPIELKQYENILLITEQILYFQEQYIKKEYINKKIDIFLLPNYETYTREIERNSSIFMGSGTLGLHIFNKEKFNKVINQNTDYTILINNPTFIFSLSQEIAKTWIRNMISPSDLTEYWFFEALATNIALLALKESKMNFEYDMEYEFYKHYIIHALDSMKLLSPPRKEYDAFLKNIIDESQVFSGISIIKMFLDMYTIYNNIEYFYEEDAEEEEEEEDIEMNMDEDIEIELYDIKDTLREFIKRYENRSVKEGEFFRCFINQFDKYTMANIFEFWISKAKGYPIIKILDEEYNIKKNKLAIHLQQLPKNQEEFQYL